MTQRSNPLKRYRGTMITIADCIAFTFGAAISGILLVSFLR